MKTPTLYSGNQIIQNPTLKNFLTENVSVRCKLFHLIEEYDTAGNFVTNTIYRLKFIDKTSIGDITDDSIAGILMLGCTQVKLVTVLLEMTNCNYSILKNKLLEEPIWYSNK